MLHHPLLTVVLDLVKSEYSKPPPKWHTLSREACKKDLAYLEKECSQASEFDPLNKRLEMITNMKNGSINLQILECDYGRLLYLHDETQVNDLPLDLWGRILRVSTEHALVMQSQAQQPKFKVFFLACTHLREFPSVNGPITAININGGYTYTCNRETIVVYRAEDATRVLIHELMHACCLDDMSLGVDRVEAETEAWAELIYVGLLSRGNTKLFHELLQKQSNWIASQNKLLRQRMKHPTEFPYRYTIAKEKVWLRWGIFRPSKRIEINNSLRLTCPPTDAIKKYFGVSRASTIL
jgi:hypothetical protein